MMNSFRTLADADRRGAAHWLERLVGIVLLAFAVNALAQAPAAPGGAAPPQAAGELDALVGRIALYPDDLVGIILPASTNPLQLVQADRYLDKRKADPKLPVDDKWDDAVKSLLNYPDVVKMMSADLDWTSALGEAVVADQGDVLEAIQSFRRRAQAAGNLKSDGKQVVQVEKEIINIVPADPQVIYVPQYNPSTVVVYGAPAWGYYPTPYPSYYYPYAPGAALAAGVIWGAAIGAAWGGNHYGCCGDANINVNRNTNINTGNINRGGGAGQLPAGGGSAWKSNKQPGQVSSSVGKTASTARAGDARRRAQARPAAGRDAHPRSPRVAEWPVARVRPVGQTRSAQGHAKAPAAEPVGVVGEAATPWAATARGDRRRWTVRVAHRAAARWPVQARLRVRRTVVVLPLRARCQAVVARAPAVVAAVARAWRRWRRARWRRPSLKAGAFSCAHSFPSKARPYP